MKLASLVLGGLLLAAPAVAQESHPADQPSPAFDRLKTLAGEWEGTAVEEGKPVPARTTYRVVSDGSALLNDLDPGTPHEMVTMFHMDGKELLMTHYCAAHNQPRLRAVPGSDPKVIAFEFKDATNLASPDAGHMHRVKFKILDADHHVEEWTYLDHGKEQTGRFEFHRKP